MPEPPPEVTSSNDPAMRATKAAPIAILCTGLVLVKSLRIFSSVGFINYTGIRMISLKASTALLRTATASCSVS